MLVSQHALRFAIACRFTIYACDLMGTIRHTQCPSCAPSPQGPASDALNAMAEVVGPDFVAAQLHKKATAHKNPKVWAWLAGGRIAHTCVCGFQPGVWAYSQPVCGFQPGFGDTYSRRQVEGAIVVTSFVEVIVASLYS